MIKKNFQVNNINIKKENFFLFYGVNEGAKQEKINQLLNNIKKENIFNYDEKQILENEESFFEEIFSYSLFEDEKYINILRASDKILKIIRIILDNTLKTKTNSYVSKTANKKNTIFFYNKAQKQRISLFKKKNIKLIKSNLIKNKNFDLKLILRKLYNLGCRNLLVEGGNDLTDSFLKNRLFNEFYLFKSNKNLSKITSHKDFDCFKQLYLNYKTRLNIKTKLGKDSIILYKK